MGELFCGTEDQHLEVLVLLLKHPSLTFSQLAFYFSSSLLAAVLLSWLELNGLTAKKPSTGRWIFYTDKMEPYLHTHFSADQVQAFRQKVGQTWRERGMSAYVAAPGRWFQAGTDAHMLLWAIITGVVLGLWAALLPVAGKYFPGAVKGMVRGAEVAAFAAILAVGGRYGGSQLFLYIVLTLVAGLFLVPLIAIAGWLVWRGLGIM